MQNIHLGFFESLVALTNRLKAPIDCSKRSVFVCKVVTHFTSEIFNFFFLLFQIYWVLREHIKHNFCRGRSELDGKVL